MTNFSEARDGVAVTPDWAPWGAPRRAEHGVETAYHHALILLRIRGGASARVVAPGEVVVGDNAAALEWSPMIWALRGRRLWSGVSELGPGTVFGGEGDRLFLMRDNVCEQVFEGAGLGARGLEGWLQTLRRRVTHCEARGIAFRQLLIPDNPALRSETIAGQPKLSPDRPLMQILRAGGEAMRQRVIYPLDEMIAGAGTAEICQPHDVHASGYGYFLAYRALIATLPGVDPATVVAERELSQREIFIAGDLARSVGAAGRRVPFHEPPPVAYRAIVKGASFQPQQVDVLRSEATHLPKLVLFRTSNSSHLMPYLMRHFSRLVAVATPQVYFDLVESEQPDVVIAEMPERYIAPARFGVNETDRATPPADPEDAFEVRTGHKLPLPTS